MIAALVFVVLVSAADAQTPETAALEQSVHDALGAGAELRLETSEPLDDTALASAANGADAAAQVVWLDSAHRRASVRCYVVGWQRVLVREVTFRDEDQLAERGRLLGFTLAAMVPDSARDEAAPPPSVRPKHEAPQASSQAEPPQAHKRTIAAAELNAVGALGLGGPADGLGVSVAGRWFFVPALSLRLVVGVRRGDVPEAHAESQWAFAGLGFGFPFSQPEDGSPFSFGGRVDLLAGSFGLRRHTSGGVPEHHERFAAAADLLGEGMYSPWRRTGITLSAGGEFAFGDTDVVVSGKPVTDIPPLRLLAEVGVRALF